mmetsp:Transcript_19533/g.45432  ORF Transcript_19533/g.45432 Transcript_19533/m.45432 type:complete len:532 (+) Transcript_19533:117-1712(+)
MDFDDSFADVGLDDGAVQDVQQCPYCGCSELINDYKSGTTSCANPRCGALLAEGQMVQEVEFVQTSSGGKAAAGFTLKPGDGLAPSQEVSLQKAMTKITWIADRLRLPQQVQDAARRIYQMAIAIGFTQGYPTRFIASSCLYLICRRQRLPHLLIDFSDILQTSVKTLGSVYVKMMRTMVGGDSAGASGLDVPIIDPSLYLERYSRKLDIAPGTFQKVQSTALRLIQFMHREWICIGRRPNGLCGAALLIATFFHGMKISAQEVADVVRMKEGTIKLRLWELRQTPLQLMNRKELDRSALDATHDHRALPPCFYKKRSRQEVRALLDGTVELPALQEGQKSIEQALMLGESESPSQDNVKDCVRENAATLAALVAAAADPVVDSPTVQAAGSPADAATPAEVPHGPASSVAGETDEGTTQEGIETLSDVDDTELSQYVLPEESSRAKSDIWHEVNKDYLEEWFMRAEDSRRKKRHAAADNMSESARSRGSKRSRGSRRSAESPVESAVAGLLKAKVKPHRINLEALEELFS